MSEYSIVPGTGAAGLDWPASGAIPASYSMGGWTLGNEGFIQQTFLGASIRNFSLTGGFGDSSSSLSVALVNDEFHKSDETARGFGDDVYHSGLYDSFAPPPVGSPVFFKFGKNHATIEQAWRKTLDDTYSTKNNPINTFTDPVPVVDEDSTSGPIKEIPDTGVYLSGTPIGTNHVWIDRSNLISPNYDGRGRDHLVFGGILQSYTENRGTGGNPLYSVQVTDPREILSNCVLILNNYGGTTYNNKNLFNIYGFLEYDGSDQLRSTLDSYFPFKRVLTKTVAPNGAFSYAGDDMYSTTAAFSYSQNGLASEFPITGQGFARRSNKGIPFYRVDQAIKALLNYGGALPAEYVTAGFGGVIDFRGFKYVVDFSGIPTEKLPMYYFLDFDQIDMLALAQELCDVMSHDLFVSLLPVIDHQSYQWLHAWNLDMMAQSRNDEMIAGVIRVDAIDRSVKPQYGSIKKFIDDLDDRGIHVENQDVGFELSNITTDKFIVGAQQVEMHYFSGNRDRDFLEVRKYKNGIGSHAERLVGDQWNLSTSLVQQILPFYGFLGKDAVTIPRGWGSYQQILLDTTALNAYGVGNYYIATEMELRAALVSYERWKEFLIMYNDVYMQSLEENDVIDSNLLMNTPAPGGFHSSPNISNNYGVSVPRCLFRSDKNNMGSDGLPESPCSPPYGYPLYYKRAEKIGIPEAGVVKIAAAKTQLLTNLAKLRSPRFQERWELAANTRWAQVLGDMENQIHAIDDKLAELVEDASEANSKGANVINFAGGIRMRDGKLITKETAGIWREYNDMKDWQKMVKDYLARVRALDLGSPIRNFPSQNIAYIEDVINRHCDLLRSVQRLGKKTIENSTKVYEFIKGIADKHLGKTYLVKIPKRVNLGYSKALSIKGHGGADVTSRISEIEFGPFGFRPAPISSELGYYYSQSFQQEISSLKSAQDFAGQSDLYPVAAGSAGLIQGTTAVTQGALKGNYNPISDKYEWNYTPDPQGGFFEFDLYSNVLTPSDLALIPDPDKLPPATKAFLCPKDITKFLSDNGRMPAYVRFDNSQFLSFHGISKDSLSQEVLTNNWQFVPDMVEELDNFMPDEFHSFNTKAILAALPKTVAFVKCEVDEKLYMPPKTTALSDTVFGRGVVDIGAHKLPKMLWDSGICRFRPSFGYYQAHYVPDPRTGGADGTSADQEDFIRNYNPLLNGDIINTSIAGLDPENVYALITLPGRIQPTIDSRMQDGPYQMFQGPTIKHYLTMDTVKGVPGFEKPTVAGRPTNFLTGGPAAPCSNPGISDVVANSFRAYREALKKLSIASPESRLHFTVPSPVYPDIVALPLLSHERCYGPWISSSLDTQAARYAGIGGKIEFIKEENLAPWNYAGYQLMNEAGKLQAQFSNSLLLFSERGGFVFPDAPKGNSLAKQLVNGGPLVTNISVNVTENSVKTTYKMDLYTPAFGKLNKQKEILIGKISRERQKIRDQQNSLIRKGLGKAQSSVNLGLIFSKFNEVLSAAKSTSFNVREMSSLQSNKTQQTILAGSYNKVENEGFTQNLDGSINHFNASDSSPEVAMMSQQHYREKMQAIYPTIGDAEAGSLSEAAVSLENLWVPGSMGPLPAGTNNLPGQGYAGQLHAPASWSAKFVLMDSDNLEGAGGASSTSSYSSGAGRSAGGDDGSSPPGSSTGGDTPDPDPGTSVGGDDTGGGADTDFEGGEGGGDVGGGEGGGDVGGGGDGNGGDPSYS